MKLKCAVCERPFDAKRASAKYCSAKCRQRSRRGSKARPRETKPAAPKKRAPAKKTAKRPASKSKAAPPPPPADPPADDLPPLVAQVTKQLQSISRVDTFEGQLALELARQMSAPGAAGLAALSRELRSVMAAAGCRLIPEDAPPEPEVEDEVEKARRARERKTRAAASRA